ncbi:MAG: ATP-binding protein [Bacilli bacterium]
MNSLLFTFASCLIAILLVIQFFSKKRIDNFETKIYSKLLIINLLFSVYAIIIYIYSKNFGNPDIINYTQKIYLYFILVLVNYIVLYNLEICNLKNIIKKSMIFIVKNILLLSGILILITPIKVVNEGYILDASGVSYNVFMLFLLIYFSLIIIISIYIFFRNRSNISKDIPFIVLIVLFILGLLIRREFPDIVFETFFFTFSLLIMYHTIENPDVKMISELNIAKENADKANRAKSDFLSSMSHEIRTPLNVIVGLSEDMESRDNCPEEMKGDLKDVVSTSRTLLEIVGNIMDISKIESDKMEIIEIPYNFKEEIETLARVQSIRIGDKPVELKVNIAEDIPYELIGDKGHVKQIINNLLSNAIKYTDKGMIDFSVRCINKNNKSLLIISCKDTGRGIKAENINKLFTKFERLEAEKNTTTEGTGLGLAITKKLVELMGGKINVESKVGKGSIFMVQIPQKISSLAKPLTETQMINTAEIISANKRKNIDYTNKKILIVEDNELNIKVARRSLKPLSLGVIEECYNGKECLDLIKSGKQYDLILMDIMMPVMSGETAIEELKKLNNFNTPIIALTADAIAGAEEKYKNMGFIDYISKPFSKDQIKLKINLIFRKSDASLKNREKNPVVDKWEDVPTYTITDSNITKKEKEN